MNQKITKILSMVGLVLTVPLTFVEASSVIDSGRALKFLQNLINTYRQKPRWDNYHACNQEELQSCIYDIENYLNALTLGPSARRALNAENNRFGYLHGTVSNRELIEQVIELLHAAESGISYPDFEAARDAANYLNALELSSDARRRLDGEGSLYTSLHGAMKNSELLRKVIELLHTAEAGLMRFNNVVNTTDYNDSNGDF